MLLPETDRNGALVVAERIREEMAGSAAPIGDATRICVTASVGVCCYPEHAGSADTLVRNADQALYAAKRLGRNRTVVCGDPAVSPAQ